MISKNIMNISIILLIISLCYLSSRLMVHKFNGDSWWINEDNISDDLNKWGDFATFFGGIFALISIYLAYRAFMSQVNASKRTSFDATFTQVFAQHHVLHEKVIQHHVLIVYGIGDYLELVQEEIIYLLCVKKNMREVMNWFKISGNVLIE